jgi:hypothetical protein
MNNIVNLSKSLLIVALVTIIILLIPLIAMQYTTEVDWSVADYIIMGTLLFGTGSAFVILTAYSTNYLYKLAMVIAVGSTFLMIWVNLAVGLIGGGAHIGNLMYAGVIVIGLVGTFLARFSSQGMAHTMFAMSAGFAVILIIALVADMQNYPGSSVIEIIGVNGFFAMLYVLAGTLFRYVSNKETAQLQKSNAYHSAGEWR